MKKVRLDVFMERSLMPHIRIFAAAGLGAFEIFLVSLFGGLVGALVFEIAFSVFVRRG